MKKAVVLLTPLLLLIIGCTSIFHPKEVSDSDCRKLYYDYRTLVTKAIKNNNEANLKKITDEYISSTGRDIPLIIVYQKSSGKWNELLHISKDWRTFLPQVNHGITDKVNIYRGENYVLLESNQIRSSTYKDNIYIRMVIK